MKDRTNTGNNKNFRDVQELLEGCQDAEIFLTERQEEDVLDLKKQAYEKCEINDYEGAMRIAQMVRNIILEGPPTREG